MKEAFEKWKKEKFPYHYYEPIWSSLMFAEDIESAFKAGMLHAAEIAEHGENSRCVIARSIRKEADGYREAIIEISQVSITVQPEFLAIQEIKDQALKEIENK